MKRKIVLFVFAVCSLVFLFKPAVLRADYEQEIRNQIKQVERRYPGDFDSDYFHDMGILTRKADEAGLNSLTTEMIGSLLFERMDQYVETQLDLIDRFFKSDPVEASRMLMDLNRQDRYYEPTDEYLSTTGGQALSSELAAERQRSTDELNERCSFSGIRKAIQSLRKTGLMVTTRIEEIKNSRALIDGLECCLNWKSKIDYTYETPFENDYDEGMMIEEGHLKIKSTPRDYKRAEWVGEWIYRFIGREGEAEAVSRATLVIDKTGQPAELMISAGRVNSVGRINFPINVSGDFRYLEVGGHSIFPAAVMPGQKSIALAGCLNTHDN